MGRLRLLLLLAALGAGQAQAGLFDDDEARKQIADFKARTEAQFDQQSRAQLDLAGQIQRQSDEIAKLRGQVETLNYDLETAKKRQQDFYIDLDSRLRKLESLGGTAAGGEPGNEGAKEAAAKPSANPALESQDYEAALNQFKASKFKEAAAGFAAFLQKYPNSDLGPNAQFWLGNAWVAQRDCRKAIEAHSYVGSKWPDSPKAPESLLAIATCQQEMGNPTGAKRTLETLVTKYPAALAAETARQRLKAKK